jgi:CTP synthase
MTEWLKGNMLEKRSATAISAARCASAPIGASARGSQDRRHLRNDPEISERHRHRYEVNIDYKERLEACGLVFSGMSPDGVLPETVEYPIIPGSSACSITRSSSQPPVRAASAVRELHRCGD